MQKTDLISGLALLLFGIVLAVFIIPLQIEESTDATLSPRLLPKICAYAIILLSAVQIFNAVFQRQNNADLDQKPPMSRSELIAMAVISALFVLCIILFNYVGPLWPGLLIVLVPMLLMGERRPLLLVLIPGSLALAVYGLVYQVLGTSLL